MARVIISSPTREELEKKINEYFYSENYIITDDLEIYNYKMDKFADRHYQIRQSRGRWQMILEMNERKLNK